MRAPKIFTVAAIAILLPAMSSFAEQRGGGGGGGSHGSGGSPPGGRAVPRGSTNPGPGHPGSAYPRPGYPGHGGPYYGYGHYYRYPYYGYPYYSGYPYYFGFGYSGFSFSLGFGYPYGYAYPYRYASPYAYGYYPSYGYPGYVAVAPGRGYGGVRIAVGQRDAEIFVDGHYVGVAEDSNGGSQQVNLEPGPHRVEVRHDHFEPVTFDVNVQPGQTVTYRTQLRPSAP